MLPGVPPELPRKLASKQGLYELCGEFGVPAPASAFPETAGEIAEFAACATFPVVVKNLEAWIRRSAPAVRELRPVSYLMGDLLDSSDETRISAASYQARVRSYLGAVGRDIDLCEIGIEVNGSWTGRYPVVSAKLTEAYQQVTVRHMRTALTLYHDAGCGDGPPS